MPMKLHIFLLDEFQPAQLREKYLSLFSFFQVWDVCFEASH